MRKVQSNWIGKCSYNGIYISASKQGSSHIEEITKYEDDESIEIDWEGDLINAFEELKK